MQNSIKCAIFYTKKNNCVANSMSKSINSSRRWTKKDISRARNQAPNRMSVEAFKAATAKDLLETDIQQDFFDCIEMIRYKGKPLKEYVYAVPNGGYRPKKTGSLMKKEGVKRGVPDIHCFIAIAPFHSLYIEMKTEKGDLSPHQERVIKLLREQGHKVVVCRSAASAVDEILKYLGI